jgi:hypothetical protein
MNERDPRVNPIVGDVLTFQHDEPTSKRRGTWSYRRSTYKVEVTAIDGDPDGDFTVHTSHGPWHNWRRFALKAIWTRPEWQPGTPRFADYALDRAMSGAVRVYTSDDALWLVRPVDFDKPPSRENIASVWDVDFGGPLDVTPDVVAEIVRVLRDGWEAF